MPLPKSRLETLKEQYLLAAETEPLSLVRRPITVTKIDQLELVARVQNRLLPNFPLRKRPSFAQPWPVPAGNTRFAIDGEQPLRQILSVLKEDTAAKEPGTFIPQDRFCFRLTVKVLLTLSDGERVYQEFDGLPGMNVNGDELDLVIQPFDGTVPKVLRINNLHSLSLGEAAVIKVGDVVGYETPWIVDGENLLCLSKGREFSPFQYTWQLPKRGLPRLHDPFFKEEVLEECWPKFRDSMAGKYENEISIPQRGEGIPAPTYRLQAAAEASAKAGELEVLGNYLASAPKKERGAGQKPLYVFVRTKAGVMNGEYFLNKETPTRKDFKHLPVKFRTTIAERWTLALAIAVGLFYERLPDLSALTVKQLRDLEKSLEPEKRVARGEAAAEGGEPEADADLKEKKSSTPLEEFLVENRELRPVFRGLRYVKSFEFGDNGQTFIYHLENPQHEIKGHLVENIGAGAAYGSPFLHDARMICRGKRAGGYARLEARKIKGVVFFIHDEDFFTKVEMFLDMYGIEPEKEKKPARKRSGGRAKKTA